MKRFFLNLIRKKIIQRDSHYTLSLTNEANDFHQLFPWLKLFAKTQKVKFMTTTFYNNFKNRFINATFYCL